MNIQSQDIEASIIAFAMEELRRLLAQRRDTLAMRFETVFGFPPTKRLPKDFLAMALVRSAVAEYWLRHAGCIQASWRQRGGASNLIYGAAGRLSHTSQDVSNTR